MQFDAQTEHAPTEIAQPGLRHGRAGRSVDTERRAKLEVRNRVKLSAIRRAFDLAKGHASPFRQRGIIPAGYGRERVRKTLCGGDGHGPDYRRLRLREVPGFFLTGTRRFMRGLRAGSAMLLSSTEASVGAGSGWL